MPLAIHHAVRGRDAIPNVEQPMEQGKCVLQEPADVDKARER